MPELRREMNNRAPQALRAAVRTVRAPFGVPLRSFAIRPRVTKAWIGVNRRHLTYSSPAHLEALLRATRRAERAGVSGEIIEAGCALGGTSIVMCAAKSDDRPMRIFDVFGMIPKPSERDGSDMQARYAEIASGRSAGLADGVYYAYHDDLMDTVANNFAQFGFPLDEHKVTMTKGKIEETLVVDGPVMIANVDVDWFEPVTACLERIVPELVQGGAVFVKAYSNWSGTKAATDEFFDRYGRSGFEFSIVEGAMLVTRLE